jgi:hypothetical protein
MQREKGRVRASGMEDNFSSGAWPCICSRCGVGNYQLCARVNPVEERAERVEDRSGRG